MTIDERSRRELHRKLESLLGEQEALTLMEHLPPIGWGDVATRRDVDTLATVLRGEIASLRSDMDTLSRELRTDMDTLSRELRTELRGESASLRGEIAGLEGRLRQEMAAQTRVLVFAMIGTMIALAALVLTASALG